MKITQNPSHNIICFCVLFATLVIQLSPVGYNVHLTFGTSDKLTEMQSYNMFKCELKKYLLSEL